MEKKKILYIMGIDWEWIYQRPQRLAHKLARDYEVTVIFPRSILNCKDKCPNEEGIELRVLRTLPYQEKNPLIEKLALPLAKKVFADIHRYDLVYVGYPLYGRYIPKDYAGCILYDCMDDHDVLYPDRKRVERIRIQERELIKRCDVLVVSSVRLQEKVDAIAGRKKSVLVRNGVEIKDILPVRAAERKDSYLLAYIGTIAGWFDHTAIEKSLEKLPEIRYRLIGPGAVDLADNRVTYTGPVPHAKLPQKIADVDCLVMPFCVNEIVEAVDPVKLYEYIAFGKCIVSVYYPEIARFEEFVWFYRTAEEYVVLLERLAEEGFPAKYDSVAQQAFLAENTWEARYTELTRSLWKSDCHNPIGVVEWGSKREAARK